MEKVGDKIYVSDWFQVGKPGILWEYNLKTQKTRELKLGSFIGSADFWIDPESNRLYMPQMVAGKVTIVDLEALPQKR